MSLDTIKEELVKLSSDEQKSVGEFLYALRANQDEALCDELTRRLNIKDESYWIPAEDAFRRLDAEDETEDEDS